MPKFPTFPTLYDEVLQLSITKLKEWNYLNDNQIKNGKITWSSNGLQTGSISVRVNTLAEQPHVELNYKYFDESIKYRINLVSIPSNLGKGIIWYFLCPETKKRCRKLYLISGYFLHREAFNGCMYKSQAQSKNYRYLNKSISSYLKSDELYEKLYSKHFKKFYRGKPTKEYQKILDNLKIIQDLDVDNLLL